MSKRCLVFYLACLLVLAPLASSSDPDLEGFEEHEVVVTRTRQADTQEPIGHPVHEGAGARHESTTEARSEPKKVGSPKKKAEVPDSLKQPVANYYFEAGAAVLIAIYIIIIFVGIRANKTIGEAWAAAYALPGGIFDRNFSFRGPKETGAVLMRDSANLFKFYASGRRYCQGLLAELHMLARQDALSMLWHLLSPSEDIVKIEAYMQEAAMPPIVLAVATPKCGRSMQRELQDINRFTKRIHVSKDMFPSWPTDKLWVLAEHSSVFQDLLADHRLQQLFSSSTAHAASMKYFRSMHFTSENSEGTYKHVLRFTFKLPPANEMQLLDKLMELVPMFIDIVGTYKMPPDLKKRALEARTKQQAEEDEEQRRKRLDAVQQKKIDKAMEERAKLQRMAPDARQKAEEKLQRQQQKKAMKIKRV